jgi:DDE superfamily endonuclease
VDHLIPSLQSLLDPLSSCFRAEVFSTFTMMTAAWITCVGRRCISRVWETTGRSKDHSHCPAFRLFSEAVWNWDEVTKIVLVQLLTAFVPDASIWLVIDDTLCHKRGAKVAFGGIFLDAVLSTKKHKTLRFGNNWVTLGLIVVLPFRKDRPFCLNILWRVCSKKDKNNPKEHRTKPELARDLVALLASWLPGRQLIAVGDSAYIGKKLLKGLPGNVSLVGPIHQRGVLTKPLAANAKKNRKIGDRLTTAAEAFADDSGWQDLVLHHPKGEKNLKVKVLGPCCWYACAGQRLLQVVLVHDVDKKWRDEALMSSDLSLTAAQVILGYMKRWSVEVAYCDAKQMLGFHDPMVRTEKAVQRAHPMAWFTGTLVVLWYAQTGINEEQAHRHRPWYKDKVSPTFADMLACLRLTSWSAWLDKEPENREGKLSWLLEYLATAP